jgi:hypothetical protein
MQNIFGASRDKKELADLSRKKEEMEMLRKR